MRSLKRAGPLAILAMLALLVVPASALATNADLTQYNKGGLGPTVPVDTVVVVGVPPAPVTIPLPMIQDRQLRIQGSAT